MAARRDQTLAVVAWQLVESLDAEVRPEFRSRAMGLGPMLLSSGLAATAAFHSAKAGPPPRSGNLKKAYGALVDGLARHVLAQPTASGRDLVVRAGAMSAAEYRAAAADARAFALWVRRAAEALIPASADRPEQVPDGAG